MTAEHVNDASRQNGQILAALAALNQRLTDYIEMQDKLASLLKIKSDELKEAAKETEDKLAKQTMDFSTRLEKKREEDADALARKVENDRTDTDRKITIKIAVVGLFLSAIAIGTPLILYYILHLK